MKFYRVLESIMVTIAIPQMPCVLSGKLLDFNPKMPTLNSYKIHSLEGNNMKLFYRIAPLLLNPKKINFVWMGTPDFREGQVKE